MASTTTLKLPEPLKARIAALARAEQRSPHGFMVEALEREVTREEHVRAFVREALASDEAIEAGTETVYAAKDVHAWLRRLAKGEGREHPAAWRG